MKKNNFYKFITDMFYMNTKQHRSIEIKTASPSKITWFICNLLRLWETYLAFISLRWATLVWCANNKQCNILSKQSFPHVSTCYLPSTVSHWTFQSIPSTWWQNTHSDKNNEQNVQHKLIFLLFKWTVYRI